MDRLNNFLSYIGYTLNECVKSSVQTVWYLDLKIGDTQIILEPFYTGYGINDVPTNDMWRTTLINNLSVINNYGYNYFLNGNQLTITSATLTLPNLGDNLSLNVTTDISINC
jgi:hypothetical protein